MWEGGAEVRSIRIRELLLRRVDVLASRTVELGPCDFEILVDGDRHRVLLFAHNSWTMAELASKVMFAHDGHSFRSADVSRVDQAVQLRGMDIELGKSVYFVLYFSS